jgi:hypothetical protein
MERQGHFPPRTGGWSMIKVMMITLFIGSLFLGTKGNYNVMMLIQNILS